MLVGNLVQGPSHIGGVGRWVECYPTLKELKEYNSIPLEDRTYCETLENGARRGQNPRLVKYEVAKAKGWVK
jgi:hypothetical protein